MPEEEQLSPEEKLLKVIQEGGAVASGEPEKAATVAEPALIAVADEAAKIAADATKSKAEADKAKADADALAKAAEKAKAEAEAKAKAELMIANVIAAFQDRIREQILVRRVSYNQKVVRAIAGLDRTIIFKRLVIFQHQGIS